MLLCARPLAITPMAIASRMKKSLKTVAMALNRESSARTANRTETSESGRHFSSEVESTESPERGCVSRSMVEVCLLNGFCRASNRYTVALKPE